MDLRANNSKITNNIIISNRGNGITLLWANNNSIENNLLTDNVYTDIKLSHYSSNNTIANNTVYHSDNGIYLYIKCKHNIIKDNTAQNCELCGINFYWDCDENIITRNLLFNNHDYGIWFYDSNNNSIYHNDLIRNNRNARDKDGINNWDNGYPSGGNYWDDYMGKDDYSGVNQNESGPDGIGDTPYNISDGNNQDQYPLMIPYGWTKLAIRIHSMSPRPSMSIKNVGNITAINVQWSIIIKGGFILIGRNSSGELLQPLPPGQEIMVKSRFFLLGLGKIEMTYTAWADNAPVVSVRINGILLLFFFRPIGK